MILSQEIQNLSRRSRVIFKYTIGIRVVLILLHSFLLRPYNGYDFSDVILCASCMLKHVEACSSDRHDLCIVYMKYGDNNKAFLDHVHSLAGERMFLTPFSQIQVLSLELLSRRKSRRYIHLNSGNAFRGKRREDRNNKEKVTGLKCSQRHFHGHQENRCRNIIITVTLIISFSSSLNHFLSVLSFSILPVLL